MYNQQQIQIKYMNRPRTNDEKTFSQAVYPSINLYSSSRVFNQKVNNAKIPLLRYREPIRVSNCSKSNDSDTIQPNYLRKIQEKDGLIYQVKNLRNQVGQIGRMKILICVCMYNESKHAINLTLNGIYNNLKHLRARGIPQGDVAVVLIQDGILKLVQDKVKKTFVKGQNSMVQFYKKLDKQQNKPKCELIQRISTILNQTQNYDRKGMIGNVSRNRDIPPSIQKNIALVYQNLWHPGKTYFENSDLPRPNATPKPNECLRLFSCFKHTNGTKLSSHLWFFQGFCRYLKPEFCVLLDVGTTPDDDGLANLISGFSISKDIGGVTGFMNVDIDFKSQEGQDKSKQAGCLQKYCFSIQRAQQYQYTISHFIDKNQESALGFLHVLPGAWSAYRYDALIKSDKYQPNLLERSYFKMILNPDLEEKDYQEANMYLAEDRILSLGIYCQMDEKYLLKYVPNAHARTDPMKDHQNLMNQRRRWINSSLFAFMYVFRNYYFNVMDSKHNFFRKYITLNISMWIAMLSTINSYIAPSIYFFVLYVTIYQIGFKNSDIVAAVVCLIYLIVFLSAVAGALTGRQWSKHAKHISVVLSVFTILLLGLVTFNIFYIYLRLLYNQFDKDNSTLMIVLILTCLNIGLYFIILLAHLFTHPRQVWSIIVNTPSYTAYTGAYAQTMVIHAFCNVDDVSWGTKGNAGSGQNKYQVNKVYFVSTWIFVNAILTFIFLYVDIISRMNDTSTYKRPDIILIIIAFYGSTTYLIKVLLALYHHFKWLFLQRCCNTDLVRKDEQPRIQVIDEYWGKVFATWRKDNTITNIISPFSTFQKPGRR